MEPRDDPAGQAWEALRSYQEPARYLAALGGTPDPGHPLRLPPATATRPSVTGEPAADGVRTYLQHSCDLTLRGGAAAAVTYPLAACALAEHYLVRRVGGAGAAAATAAAVAAAELGRTAVPGPDGPEGGPDGRPDGLVLPGYAGLAQAVGWLAGDDRTEGPTRLRLARMLSPSPALRGPFLLFCALVGPVTARRAPRRLVAVLAALAASASRAGRLAVALVWIGVAAGWAGLTVALLRSPTVEPWVVAAASPPLLATVALAGLAATALVGVLGLRATLTTEAAREHYGLVPGVPLLESAGKHPGAGLLERLAGRPDPAGLPPLVTWIADLLDDLAGLPARGGLARDAGVDLPNGTPTGAGGRALTFGDLWLGRTWRTEGDGERLRRADADHEQRVVDLQLIATDVTLGRPVRLPPRPGWLFCASCLRVGVPDRAVTQLVDAPQPKDAAGRCPVHDEALRSLPAAADVPVVVAVRLAVAPAGLLSAVPLYRVGPASAPEIRDAVGAWAGRESTHAADTGVTTHWFCDAGADADVDLFDSVLPRWPTLGLVVRDGAVEPDDGDGPWVDVAAASTRPRPTPALAVTGVRDMVRAVLTARAGAADRVAAGRQGEQGRLGVVRRGTGTATGPFLSGGEVLRLALRGHHAGRELRAVLTGRDGDVGTQTGTDRYRWLRLRTALRAQRELSLVVAARMPIYGDVAAAYRVPADVAGWFTPPVPSGRVDPAWADATAALTHLRSLAGGGVLDWDTDYGAPPRDDEP